MTQPEEEQQLEKTIFPDDDGQDAPAEPGDGVDVDDEDLK